MREVKVWGKRGVRKRLCWGRSIVKLIKYNRLCKYVKKMQNVIFVSLIIAILFLLEITIIALTEKTKQNKTV